MEQQDSFQEDQDDAVEITFLGLQSGQKVGSIIWCQEFTVVHHQIIRDACFVKFELTEEVIAAGIAANDRYAGFPV